ncbi:MAG: zinc ribbon domain-containing protein [Nibricoccus sp.]
MSAAANKKFTAPSECPVCGADVPPNARACPECGADERSGWNDEDTRYDGLDLPDSAFEDKTLSAPDKRRASTPQINGIALHWWLLALLLLAILILGALGIFRL